MFLQAFTIYISNPAVTMLLLTKAMEINLTILLAIALLAHHHIIYSASTLTDLNTDQSALLAFKSHLHSDPSQILSKNWSASASVCNWIGITCSSRNQRVAALDISMMSLTGTLVPHLGNLTFLVSLNTSNNNFNGIVPREFARLWRLKVVDFNFNALTGQIPSWLGSFYRLQVLYLKNNSFTGLIPPSLFNASKLEYLDLSYNPLRGRVPTEVGNLRNLKWLVLQYNQLSGVVPFTLFNLSQIQVLDLTGNTLSGTLPRNLCRDLPKLDGLFLSSNELSGQLPLNMSCCSRLQIFSISYNNFGGSIPREMGKASMLEMLYIGANNLTGAIPEELGNLTRLTDLDMSRNKLVGSIPPQIFNISSLRNLNLGRNKLSGMLPADMCSNLPQLEAFYLASNGVYGFIPNRLSQCSALHILSLSDNKLYGTIPPDLCNTTTLKVLALSGNKIKGDIPKEVGNLNNLEEIHFNENRLSGSIPPSLLNISTLRFLSLSENKLTGKLTSSFGHKLNNLEELDLDGNFLTSESSEMGFITSLKTCRYLNVLSMAENPLHGIIPRSIGNLSTSLQYLYFKSCDLSGRVPDEIGNLTNLMVLSARGNHLTGPIPKSLRNLQSLQGLSFSGNKISGAITSIICELGNLNVLYLGDNQFSGAIPDCIENISSLSTLTLDSNKLSSNIPTSLWNLRGLLELNLSSNSLVGSLVPEMANLKDVIRIDLSLNQLSSVIPSTIEELQTLSSLNLSRNELQGTIPESMAKMVNLEVLDLSHNDLSGVIPMSLQKLRHLTFFNVSFNGLNGEIPSDGPFENFTFKSFVFNKGLCGDPKYRVLPCHSTSKVERSNMNLRALVISLGIASLVVLVVILACGIARYRKKGNASIPIGINSLPGGHELRVSYYELLAATNGYNESNFVGCGSFGSVYKGTLENGNDVAVKVFNLELEGAFRSFEVECEVLRNLRHRNLCKVIGCCSNQDFKALVLEYMPCGSLEKWLYSHNYFLDVIQRINIMIDVACALEYLHQSCSVPVIHCDLKPSNILLDQNMTARLCDFGIAKLLGDGESIVQTMTLATLSYIAPEYGMGGFVSVKCDVYSYGIVLMEVFTRNRPNDEIFSGNLSLRTWVKDSMPNAVINIIDSNLLRRDEDASMSQKLSCLSSIMELGLNCSVESPNERMGIKDVIVALSKIKLQLLTV
ncbi:hypothetical protein CASFOL_001872 [Castilleja foliolosa]|uniref:non-specific serine/threonine protein kinase n=1 Tax=Castilleja foliolosa TaxID=1961234 RepID=A0ABD3ECS4_9LAMI